MDHERWISLQSNFSVLFFHKHIIVVLIRVLVGEGCFHLLFSFYFLNFFCLHQLQNTRTQGHGLNVKVIINKHIKTLVIFFKLVTPCGIGPSEITFEALKDATFQITSSRFLNTLLIWKVMVPKEWIGWTMGNSHVE